MALDWHVRRDVADLISRGKYAPAIQLLQEQLDREVADPWVRLQLADALTLAGRKAEAVPILDDLADEYAGQGQAAKAIALLKKIQKLDPSRRDVEKKLAGLIKTPGRARPGAGGWQPREGVDKLGYEPSGATFSAEHFEAQAVPDPAQRIEAARKANWQPSTHQEGEVDPMFAGVAARSAPVPPPPVEEAAIEVTPEPVVEAEVKHSLLFSGFSEEELVAVIQGLRLLSYEPGDIILTQGDPGDSLFVLTEGTVKAFVRPPQGHGQVLARTMEEGDFFGEISILSGKPRTATITAATRCELLELDRATLDGITATYPHVRNVLEDFYIQRASG